jgi:hypothetical protein
MTQLEVSIPVQRVSHLGARHFGVQTSSHFEVAHFHVHSGVQLSRFNSEIAEARV